MKQHTASADIKTEVLQIIEAFNLGEFLEFESFKPSENVSGYILTKFKTNKGTFKHYYRYGNN
jgi:hypothetical protein